MNLVFLVVIDLFFRKEPVWRRTSRGHVLASAFGVLMLGLTLIALQMGQVRVINAAGSTSDAMQYGFTFVTPGLVLLYLVAMRTVFT